MKRIFYIFILCSIAGNAFAQNKISKVNIGEGIYVTANIGTFYSTKHHYDTCDTDFGWRAICLIDGQPWFGCDAGVTLPRNQINSMRIDIKGIITTLEISGMFNPNFENKLQKEQFRIKKTETGYLLCAYFSDGAGTYVAEWLIIKGRSVRTKLTTDEREMLQFAN